MHALTLLPPVRHADHARRFIQHPHLHAHAGEDLAQLVTHQVDDGLEVHRRGHTLLDAVDQCQLGGALFGLGLGAARLMRAFGHLRFQPAGKAQVGQRHCGLAGQHGQQVAVGIAEAAEGAFDVGIHVAEQLALCHQRRYQARALVFLRRVLGAVAQARLARGGGFVQPRRHRLQQRGGVLAAGQQRAGDVARARAFQHQQHALGAAEFGELVDQEVVQRCLVAQLVKAQAAVHQALEGVGQAAGQPQVFQALRVGHAAPRRFGQPGRHQCAVDPQLVQVAAAQAFVVQVAHRHQHQAIRLLQCGPGLVVAAQARQCAAVPPPNVLALSEAGAGEAALALQGDAALRGAQRRGGIAALQQQPGQWDLHIQLEAGVVGAHMPQEGAQPLQGAGAVAFSQPQLGGHQFAVVGGDRLVQRTDQRVVTAPALACTGHVAQIDVPLQHRTHFQRPVQRGAQALGQGHAAFAQPAGMTPQAEFGKAEGQVAQHDHPAEQVPGAFEGLRGLAQHVQAFGDVGAAEAQHVERIGQAEQVAGLPCQRRGMQGRGTRGFVLRPAGLREGDEPVGAAAAGDVTPRIEQAGRALRAGQGSVVRGAAQLRFGQAEHAVRERHVVVP